MNTLGIENIIKYCDELNIILDISFNYSDNICIISLIKIPIYLRGKGLLKKILKMLILDCNKNNLILALTPSNRYGSNLERLEQFYKSFGFIENKSSNKNFLTKFLLGIKYFTSLKFKFTFMFSDVSVKLLYFLLFSINFYSNCNQINYFHALNFFHTKMMNL